MKLFNLSEMKNKDSQHRCHLQLQQFQVPDFAVLMWWNAMKGSSLRSQAQSNLPNLVSHWDSKQSIHRWHFALQLMFMHGIFQIEVSQGEMNGALLVDILPPGCPMCPVALKLPSPQLEVAGGEVIIGYLMAAAHHVGEQWGPLRAGEGQKYFNLGPIHPKASPEFAEGDFHLLPHDSSIQNPSKR